MTVNSSSILTMCFPIHLGAAMGRDSWCTGAAEAIGWNSVWECVSMLINSPWSAHRGVIVLLIWTSLFVGLQQTLMHIKRERKSDRETRFLEWIACFTERTSCEPVFPKDPSFTVIPRRWMDADRCVLCVTDWGRSFYGSKISVEALRGWYRVSLWRCNLTK